MGERTAQEGAPRKVNSYDFPAGVPKAVPYGVYDIAQDQGWVNVGYDDDAVFITIEGRRHYRWRALDQDGDVIDILVQKRRDKRAAKRFFRKRMPG